MRFTAGFALLLALTCAAYASEPIPDCNDPQSNFEMKMCAKRELTQAEAELKTAFQRALTAANTQYEMERHELGFENMPNMPEELRKTQNAWETYRDLNCGYQRLVYYGGSMASLAVTGCLRDMTRARTKELNDIADPG
ncbi:MAG: DUF1311 domain-containing protein [Alphaproteobacteria bacterium]|nr:DUF1311 domain-containing protein [Alphaproteobacteria bacterium]